MGAGYEGISESYCDRVVRDLSDKNDRKKRTAKGRHSRLSGSGYPFLSGMFDHHGIVSMEKICTLKWIVQLFNKRY